MDFSVLKQRLLNNDPAFWPVLELLTREAADFEELFSLACLRKKAQARQVRRSAAAGQKIRLAVCGGYSLYPFHELLSLLCDMEGVPCELWLGEYDNYLAEIADQNSPLYSFGPQVVLLLPAESRCVYPGKLSDSRQAQQDEAGRVVQQLLDLARTVHGRGGAEVIMTNFMLPARHDPGTYRCRTLGSDWSFRKWVNLELGLNAPPYLHICDLEFLAHRRGGLQARDERAWFESKQPCSPALIVDLAREAAHLVRSLRQAPRKVLALDLDNTLWGGVIGEDGLEGLELGDTSPRGEAFKAFQHCIKSLKDRGVLLAVCSKNEHATAAAAFENHPEMVLRMDDLVSFKANWDPKPDNLRAMAAELNLGLDSFVFVDDNPAEIEIVRQFTPEVKTILLGPDPSQFAGQLLDCRLFEPRSITAEDADRTTQYRADAQRKALAGSVTDMGAYLASLAMEACISQFTAVDVPRLAQLINKSNQFNLTTRRRTEADLLALMGDPGYVGFSVRLKDRFGDHGLISVVIGRVPVSGTATTEGEWVPEEIQAPVCAGSLLRPRTGALQSANGTMHIDTWLMSCRVLNRQVEQEALNELVRLALERNCSRLAGAYLPTPKNQMVRDFYSRMGFALTGENEQRRLFELPIQSFQPLTTPIKVLRHAYEPG